MKKAAIVYRSHTGTTRRFAEEIGAYLTARGVEARVASVGECDLRTLGDVDYLILGCWTNGLMVLLQHPDQPWIDFARAMPAVATPRVALFTTYKLATGRMFKEMRRHLAGKTAGITLELKSRDGRLSDRGRRALDEFLAG